MLLDYIASEPFRQFSRMDVKISEEYRKKMGELPEEYRKQMRELLEGEIGSIITETGDYINPGSFCDPGLRFKGNVYLLTSRLTFSSATLFAATVKDFGFGTIVGEETGGLPTLYGDCIYITLPNSGLGCSVSCKYFVRPSGIDDGRGVLPDYEIKPQPEDLITGEDRALNLVLDLIGEE